MIFTQATIPNISAVKYAYLSIPLPSLVEQQKIIDHLVSELGKVSAVERTLRDQIDTLTAYRKSLIHECVIGKRRITDADVARVEAHV